MPTSADITTILEIGYQRGRSGNLTYAGALTPAETYALLIAQPNAILVDVRTNAERDWVGRVVINEDQHAAIQWTQYPGGVENPDFLAQLALVADLNTTILFLCRSGVRSRHAATLASEHGYVACFDILEGFEGDKDARGHRKSIGGWCKADLPWTSA